MEETIRTSIKNKQAISAVVEDVIAQSLSSRPANTRKNYDNKQREWIAWCQSREFDNGSIVSEGKLLLFVKEVIEKRGNRTAVDGRPVPLSKDGMEGYIKAIVDLYKIQCTLGENVASNAPRGKALKEYLRTRKRDSNKRKREEFVDRGIGTILDAYNGEDMLKVSNYFMKGANTGSSLRDRLDFLLSHGIMARGESTRLMQLADLFPLELVNEGPSRCVALVVVMQQGKMNQVGRLEYGACMRHKDVELCPIGALALYLFWRFHVSNEPFPQMLDRRQWYNIFLLLGQDPTKEISDSAQAKGMKGALIGCGILSSKVTHIRRSGASQMAEAYGASEAQIRRAGRWNTGKMEGCYLTSLPKKAMRALAHFHVKGGEFFLPRAQVEPSEALLEMVFPDAPAMLSALESGESERDLAAQGFLRLLKELRLVLLQDVALLSEKYPDHPVWRHEIFRSPEYHTFADLVREKTSVPNRVVLDTQLRTALPILSNVLQAGLQDVSAKLTTFEASMQQLQQKVDAVANMRLEVTLTPSITTGGAISECARTRTGTTESSSPENGDPVQYSLSRSLTKVTDVWREYDQGINSGPAVRSLESQFGAKWRSSEKERRFFSRRNVIYKFVHENTVSGKSADDVVNWLEEDRLRRGCSLDGLMKLIRCGKVTLG